MTSFSEFEHHDWPVGSGVDYSHVQTFPERIGGFIGRPDWNLISDVGELVGTFLGVVVVAALALLILKLVYAGFRAGWKGLK